MAVGSDDKKELRSGAWRVLTQLADEAALADLHERCTPELFAKRDAPRAELVFAPATPQTRTLNCHVHKLSPFAAELLPADVCPPLLPAQCTLSLRLGSQTLHYNSPTLFRQSLVKGQELIAVRLMGAAGAAASPAGAAPAGDTRREHRRIPRWRCHPDFLPLASAPHPLRGGETLQFKVADLSASGMQLLGSMKCMAVLPQTRLALSVTLPENKKLSVNVEVAYGARVQLNDKPHLAFGVRMLDLNSRGKQLLQAYMAAYAGNQMQAPVVAGPKKSLVPALSFRWVQSDSDYEAALVLRRALQASRPEQTVDDPYDKRARILLVHSEAKLIATLRMVYSAPGEGLEIEQFTDIGGLHLDRPALVEVSALCVGSEVRIADVLGPIMHYAMLTAVQSGRRFVLVWCPKEMLPAYERLGCDATGMVLTNGFDDGKARHVLIADTQKLLHGGASAQAFKQFVGRLKDAGDEGQSIDAADATPGVLHSFGEKLKGLFTARK